MDESTEKYRQDVSTLTQKMRSDVRLRIANAQTPTNLVYMRPDSNENGYSIFTRSLKNMSQAKYLH